jgi:hypothetical protein
MPGYGCGLPSNLRLLDIEYPFGLLQKSYSRSRFLAGKEVHYGHYDLRLGCYAPEEHR